MCKTCTRCKKQYYNDISDNFYSRKNSKDGFNTVCKHCFLIKKHKVKHISDDGKVLCLVCNIYKDENEFNVSKTNWFRKHKDRRCKDCKIKQYHKRRISNRGDCGLERLITERYCGLRDRAKDKGLIVDFDKTYLKYLWEQQKGLCAISGVEMTTKVFSGRVPTNLSVDRINSMLGYTKQNIQLVCMAVNQMKNDLIHDELIFFCNKIIENEKKNNNN